MCIPSPLSRMGTHMDNGVPRTKSLVVFPFLHGHTLNHVQVIKYLGVSISNKIRWDTHINNITGKANKTLGSIRRKLNISNIKIKPQAYNSLVQHISQNVACPLHVKCHWDYDVLNTSVLHLKGKLEQGLVMGPALLVDVKHCVGVF